MINLEDIVHNAKALMNQGDFEGAKRYIDKYTTELGDAYYELSDMASSGISENTLDELADTLDEPADSIDILIKNGDNTFN